jgi:hypothetical protein
MGTIYTHISTYILKSLGFIFGCLQQHTKNQVRTWLNEF